MFSIAFEKLTDRLIPWMLLKEIERAWINALLQPLNILYALFLDFRQSKLFEAQITGQVMSLEYALNDIFYGNGFLNHIYITDDPSDPKDLFLFNKIENQTKTFIFNVNETSEPGVFIYNSDETAQYDFIVMVPNALIFDYDYMFSLVTKFKEAGPNFKIQSY